jgi:hypothetical protein
MANIPKLGGGDVSGGKKDMEITGDKDLDRARDHVLHDTMHNGGGVPSSSTTFPTAETRT